MSDRVVHVDIHGQRYAVRSELDPKYIGELACYLDEKMKSASRELSTTDALRVAVIAALNISDELFRARLDSLGPDGHVRARAAEIERLLDAVLEEANAEVVNK
jgi:cell division protein ZapA